MFNKKIKSPVSHGVAKVPVVMQMEALECGAATLAMILAYYNKWIPLEQVRYDCGVSRDGSSAKNVVMAARNYGLKATAYKMEPETLKERGTFPCIVHWEFNHFIVVNGFRGNKVYINDPARGNLAISIEEFDEGFTGVCLFFEPTEEFSPSGSRKSMLSYAAKRLKGAKGAVIFVMLTTAIASLLGVFTPGFTRLFTDYLLDGKNPKWVPYFCTALIIFAFIQLLVNYLNAIYGLRISGKLAAVGNTSYLWKVFHLPMNFFSQRMAGDIQMRQAGNATIAGVMVNTFAPLLLKSVMLVFYLVVMLRQSVILSLVGILSIVVNLFVSNYISKKRINVTRGKTRDSAKLASTTVAGIEMIESIKSSGSENGFFEKWAGYQANVNSENVRFAKINTYLGMIPGLVSSLTDLAVLFIGVILTAEGQFTIGSLMAFQGLLGSFEEPAMTLITTGQSLQEMRTDMERIEDVMSYPDDDYIPDEELSEDLDYKKLTGKLSMKNVTFGYSRLSEPLIKDFNLEIMPGHSVAFVGGSGCGKSTLAKLISGLNKPWEGEILFDDMPINTVNRKVLTGSLAVVDQEITMYEDTISNNIKMWDRSIEDFEMIMAAKDAQIHDTIVQRNSGYDYKVTDGGRDFSGGEKQRLELARVLASDPTILILDEATSALDARTEYEVVRSIKERGITCIVVAHRLSTIRHCDEIIVLDHGEVVERGTHDELYAKGGLYTELVSNE